MSSDETREYPLRTDHLNKGDTVTVDDIEAAFHVQRGTDEYTFALFKARGYITMRLAERGVLVVLKQHRNDLRILTDREAAEETDNGFALGVKRLRRRLAEQSSVDRANLTEVERAAHDRNLSVNGRSYAGLTSSRREAVIALRPTERKTPALK